MVDVEVQEEKVLTKKVWKNALKIFAISLLALVFVFFFAISSMFVFAPKIDAKIFKFFGLTKAEETCYVRAYEISESNADLYNLIVFESELENYEKELYYLNLLMSDDEYVEFYQKLDKSAIETISDKSIVAYACNTNGYLINQKIKCMYELGFDNDAASPTIRNYVKTVLDSDNLFDTAFLTYVELIYNDESLTDDDKKQRLEVVYGSVDVLLTNRLKDLKEYIKGNLTLVDKIIAQNAIVNIRKADYLIDKVNESLEEESSKEAYELALSEYNNLIK